MGFEIARTRFFACIGQNRRLAKNSRPVSSRPTLFSRATFPQLARQGRVSFETS